MINIAGLDSDDDLPPRNPEVGQTLSRRSDSVQLDSATNLNLIDRPAAGAAGRPPAAPHPPPPLPPPAPAPAAMGSATLPAGAPPAPIATFAPTAPPPAPARMTTSSTPGRSSRIPTSTSSTPRPSSPAPWTTWRRRSRPTPRGGGGLVLPDPRQPPEPGGSWGRRRRSIPATCRKTRSTTGRRSPAPRRRTSPCRTRCARCSAAVGTETRLNVGAGGPCGDRLRAGHRGATTACVKVLGQGMGTVCVAEQRSLDRKVALKVIKP